MNFDTRWCGPRKRLFGVKKPSYRAKKLRVISWDIESWGLNPAEPALITYRFDKKYPRYEQEGYFKGENCKQEFIDFCNNLPTTYNHRLYAHNGAKFDNHAVFTAQEIANAVKFAAGSRIFYIKLDTEKGNVEFRDSRHVLSAPLRAFDSEAASKGETPMKFIDDANPDYGNYDSINEEDIRYGMDDVRVLDNAIKDTVKELEGIFGVEGLDMPLTASTMANVVYSKFWPDDWTYTRTKGKNKGQVEKAIEINVDIDNIGRKCFVGGRTQTLAQRNHVYKDVASFDFNSLYPSVMMLNKFPNPRHMKAVPNQRTWDMIREKGLPYWGWVRLEPIGSDARQFLPGLDEKGRRCYVHDGAYEGYLCSPEIEHAEKHGWKLVDCKQMCYSLEWIEPFKGFVEDMYARRLVEKKKPGGGREFFYKILMNSFYGGFAMRPPILRVERPEDINEILAGKVPESLKGTKESEDLWAGHRWNDVFTLKMWNNDPDNYYLEGKTEGNIPRRACYTWASFITCYARLALENAIHAAQDAGYETVYCDTDSVHIAGWEPEMEVPFDIGSDLGQLELESVRMKDGTLHLKADEAVYWEPKAYTWAVGGEKIKIKHKGANRSDGDLTKAQLQETVRSYRVAMRTGLPAGMLSQKWLKSKRWYREED